MLLHHIAESVYVIGYWCVRWFSVYLRRQLCCLHEPEGTVIELSNLHDGGKVSLYIFTYLDVHSTLATLAISIHEQSPSNPDLANRNKR